MGQPKPSFGNFRKPEKTELNKKKEPTKQPEGGCLKCKGEHWSVNCPTASTDEKKQLLRQQHERRNHERKSRKVGEQQ